MYGNHNSEKVCSINECLMETEQLELHFGVLYMCLHSRSFVMYIYCLFV